MSDELPDPTGDEPDHHDVPSGDVGEVVDPFDDPFDTGHDDPGDLVGEVEPEVTTGADRPGGFDGEADAAVGDEHALPDEGIVVDDPWSDAQDPDGGTVGGIGDGAGTLDLDDPAVIDEAEVTEVAGPAPDEGVHDDISDPVELTGAVLDSLELDPFADLDLPLVNATAGWWSSGSPLEPSATVWDVPVTDPDPGFIDIDLLS